ncbi:MAG TPA: ECF transporter S component, partial [Spirochaetia bacterium]|nr:ECF transporter S component [Spirochaetia bacterium]
MRRNELVVSPALRVSTLAILAAVTTVFTIFIRIPSPARGYFNLGDVAVAFTAFTFGPVSALIAGGVGTALADLVGSYVQWAPISLVVHGLEGLVIGLIARIRPDSAATCILAGAVGIIV